MLKTQKILPKIILSIFILGSIAGSLGPLAAQNAQGCDEPGRYLLPVFQNVTSTNVVYGSNRTVNGQNRVLTMDVYEPAGDMLEKRPAIIWVHGGSFIFGGRADVRDLAETYARLGYVTASIDYRLFPIALGIPDSTEALDAAIKAMGDLKAAIRHLRKDADTDNRFRVDPDHIIIGGISAGAITAIHAGMLSEGDDIPAHVQEVIDENGGLEGSSGDSANLSYSSDVSAIISLSGAINRPEWVTEDDPPIASFHAKDDDVVPFNTDFARIFGMDIILLNGSGVIHQRANEIGLNNYLLSTETGGHTAIYTDPAYEPQRIEFALNATQFLKEIICDDSPTFAFDRNDRHEISVFPNPASHGVQIVLDGSGTGSGILGRIYDLQGQIHREVNFAGHAEMYIDRAGLPSGMYLFQLFDGQGRIMGEPVKVVFD